MRHIAQLCAALLLFLFLHTSLHTAQSSSQRLAWKPRSSQQKKLVWRPKSIMLSANTMPEISDLKATSATQQYHILDQFIRTLEGKAKLLHKHSIGNVQQNKLVQITALAASTYMALYHINPLKVPFHAHTILQHYTTRLSPLTEQQQNIYTEHFTSAYPSKKRHITPWNRLLVLYNGIADEFLEGNKIDTRSIVHTTVETTLCFLPTVCSQLVLGYLVGTQEIDICPFRWNMGPSMGPHELQLNSQAILYALRSHISYSKDGDSLHICPATEDIHHGIIEHTRPHHNCLHPNPSTDSNPQQYYTLSVDWQRTIPIWTLLIKQKQDPMPFLAIPSAPSQYFYSPTTPDSSPAKRNDNSPDDDKASPRSKSTARKKLFRTRTDETLTQFP